MPNNSPDLNTSRNSKSPSRMLNQSKIKKELEAKHASADTILSDQSKLKIHDSMDERSPKVT